ncbi:MAG: hypothetical protein HY843_08640 [Bdellovibrio sp.]|nr:hypothetical protein [Bdellovibrio sp.]
MPHFLLHRVILLSFLLIPTLAHARDLQGRMGLGYNAEFSNFQAVNGVPGISIKYGLSREFATELVLGTATSSPGNTVAAIKGFKNLFFETNLNFYFMAGAGIVSASSKSGFEMIAGFGAEAFIPGVESLGFSMEVGASFTNISGSFVLKTLGVSFLNAGIHFYF